MNCPNCGSQVAPDMNNCPYCGTRLNNNQNYQNNQAYQNNQNYQNNQQPMFNGSRPVIQQRNVVLAVILSLVTCGIYGLYWFICLTDESNSLSNTKTASGGLAILYTILTCGIYGIYWYYMMGKKMNEAGNKYGIAIADNSILYLILSVIGFGLINEILIQIDLNKFATQ